MKRGPLSINAFFLINFPNFAPVLLVVIGYSLVIIEVYFSFK
jgi:hypothetical protein